MNEEDLISEYLNLNKLLLQLKDEIAFLRQQNNKKVDNLFNKLNEKPSKQIHNKNKVQKNQQQSKIFSSKVETKIDRHLFYWIVNRRSSSERCEFKYSYTLLSFSKSSRPIQYCT